MENPPRTRICFSGIGFCFCFCFVFGFGFGFGFDWVGNVALEYPIESKAGNAGIAGIANIASIVSNIQNPGFNGLGCSVSATSVPPRNWRYVTDEAEVTLVTSSREHTPLDDTTSPQPRLGVFLLFNQNLLCYARNLTSFFLSKDVVGEVTREINEPLARVVDKAYAVAHIVALTQPVTGRSPKIGNFGKFIWAGVDCRFVGCGRWGGLSAF
jgi:hypothetical protein